MALCIGEGSDSGLANYYLYALQDVADFHPLHCHSLSTGYMKKYLIRLPYHLF